MKYSKRYTRTLADVRSFNALIRFKRRLDELSVIVDIIVRLQAQYNGRIEFPSPQKIVKDYRKKGIVAFKLGTETIVKRYR